MSAPWFLLCALVFLFLISQIRVGCKAIYDHSGIQIFIRLAMWHIRVFPLQKKQGANNNKKEKKANKPPKERKSQEPIPLQEKIGGALGYAQALLPVLLDAVKYFFKKLQVDTLHLRLVAGSSDPSDAAMLYGKASAALGALWYPLTEAFDVKDGHAKVDLNFDAERMELYAAAALSIQIGQMIWMTIYFGIWVLVRFLRERRHQKHIKKLGKAV